MLKLNPNHKKMLLSFPSILKQNYVHIKDHHYQEKTTPGWS